MYNRTPAHLKIVPCILHSTYNNFYCMDQPCGNKTFSATLLYLFNSIQFHVTYIDILTKSGRFCHCYTYSKLLLNNPVQYMRKVRISYHESNILRNTGRSRHFKMVLYHRNDHVIIWSYENKKLPHAQKKKKRRI